MDIQNYNDFSYLIGLLQTDGSLYDDKRNRGKLQLEIGIKDQDIIYKLSKIIPVNNTISERKRTTNKGYLHSICLRVCNLNFRDLIKEWGVPAGKKSQNISPPLHIQHLSVIDYIR